jgi:protease I
MAQLNGMRVAILVAEGFEQVEMTEPRKALDEAGAKTSIVSPERDEVQGWNHFDKADKFKVDVPLEKADAADFDALHLPGGVANPDQLRMIPEAVQFVRDFFDMGKPVSVICHGSWTLIDAQVVRGRDITSWPSLRMDLINAGAVWMDREVVIDDGLVSSRKPDDIPAFNRAMLDLFAGARNAQATGSSRQQQGTGASPSTH